MKPWRIQKQNRRVAREMREKRASKRVQAVYQRKLVLSGHGKKSGREKCVDPEGKQKKRM